MFFWALDDPSACFNWQGTPFSFHTSFMRLLYSASILNNLALSKPNWTFSNSRQVPHATLLREKIDSITTCQCPYQFNNVDKSNSVSFLWRTFAKYCPNTFLCRVHGTNVHQKKVIEGRINLWIISREIVNSFIVIVDANKYFDFYARIRFKPFF